MYPSSQDRTGSGANDLESRLRGLILSNANVEPPSNNEAAAGSTPPLSSNVKETAYQPRLPPHMLGASPRDQQEYLDNLSRPRHPQNTNSQSTQSKGRRPNQAQRRQMNSQLSIPIENRTQQANRSPGQGPISGYGQPQWATQSHHGPPHMQPQQQSHQRQQQNQPYSPRYQNHGPATPYSAHNSFSQDSPRSPIPPYQHGGRGHNAPHQSLQSQHFQDGRYSPRQPPQGKQLYQPGPYQGQSRGGNFNHNSDDAASQSSYLDGLIQKIIPLVGIEAEEEAEKEAFRTIVEQACRDSISSFEQIEVGDRNFDPISVELQCFGSMRSGFATKASDMDLALLSPKSQHLPDAADSPIPRLLEKTLLDLGFGARLLTRTRVPIIKLCQLPTEKLRADLLVERTKWENGFSDELDGATDSQEPQAAGTSKHDTETEDVDRVANPGILSKAPPGSGLETYDSKLASFKQEDQQSLGDYHSSAKRLLRQLGSRDITSVMSDVNPEEAKILNDVCKAFISGLSSAALLERLKSYMSVSALFDSSRALVRRTLQGVWLQVDGERLAMCWDSRPLTEDTEARESECQHVIDDWIILQKSPAPTTFDECITFNRDLYIANERLRRITSLQLACLEQIQHEELYSYFLRAQKLQDLLKRREALESTVVPIVVAHYINGICSPDIRKVLQPLATTSTTLYRAAAQHRVIQLAADYEHALNTELYEEANRPLVEQYVAYLKSINVTRLDYHINSVNNGGDPNLIAKVRLLADPSTTSLHKPRDRYRDPLEYPKTGIGIQCDINFSAHLAIHNTLLLRCYSHCDPRVKIMVLFVKNWAKLRGINTPYRGSLSSYGYVLMVLHYLVNVVQPFVCPNLQVVNKEPPNHLSPAEVEARTTCNGCDVRFWRNEAEIKNLAERKMLNHNYDSVGFLLSGFFEYYAQSGQMTTVPRRGFDWGREVLSLRTQGGIMSKQEKGWVGAKTIIETNLVAPPTSAFAKPTSPTENSSIAAPAWPKGDIADEKAVAPTKAIAGEEAIDAAPKPKVQKQVEETKEIRHRYLFAIEDPFELGHNVARTVTHNGIVSIRDEFRRAWRILRNIGKPEQRDGGLLDPLGSAGSGGINAKGSFQELMYMLHGPAPRAQAD